MRWIKLETAFKDYLWTSNLNVSLNNIIDTGGTKKTDYIMEADIVLLVKVEPLFTEQVLYCPSLWGKVYWVNHCT